MERKIVDINLSSTSKIPSDILKHQSLEYKDFGRYSINDGSSTSGKCQSSVDITPMIVNHPSNAVKNIYSSKKSKSSSNYKVKNSSNLIDASIYSEDLPVCKVNIIQNLSDSSTDDYINLKREQLLKRTKMLEYTEKRVRLYEEAAQAKLHQALIEKEEMLSKKEKNLNYRMLLAQRQYEAASRLLGSTDDMEVLDSLDDANFEDESVELDDVVSVSSMALSNLSKSKSISVFEKSRLSDQNSFYNTHTHGTRKNYASSLVFNKSNNPPKGHKSKKLACFVDSYSDNDKSKVPQTYSRVRSRKLSMQSTDSFKFSHFSNFMNCEEVVTDDLNTVTISCVPNQRKTCDGNEKLKMLSFSSNYQNKVCSPDLIESEWSLNVKTGGPSNLNSHGYLRSSYKNDAYSSTPLMQKVKSDSNLRHSKDLDEYIVLDYLNTCTEADDFKIQNISPNQSYNLDLLVESESTHGKSVNKEQIQGSLFERDSPLFGELGDSEFVTEYDVKADQDFITAAVDQNNTKQNIVEHQKSSGSILETKVHDSSPHNEDNSKINSTRVIPSNQFASRGYSKSIKQGTDNINLSKNAKFIDSMDSHSKNKISDMELNDEMVSDEHEIMHEAIIDSRIEIKTVVTECQSLESGNQSHNQSTDLKDGDGCNESNLVSETDELNVISNSQFSADNSVLLKENVKNNSLSHYVTIQNEEISQSHSFTDVRVNSNKNNAVYNANENKNSLNKTCSFLQTGSLSGDTQLTSGSTQENTNRVESISNEVENVGYEFTSDDVRGDCDKSKFSLDYMQNVEESMNIALYSVSEGKTILNNTCTVTKSKSISGETQATSDSTQENANRVESISNEAENVGYEFTSDDVPGDCDKSKFSLDYMQNVEESTNIALYSISEGKTILNNTCNVTKSESISSDTHVSESQLTSGSTHDNAGGVVSISNEVENVKMEFISANTRVDDCGNELILDNIKNVQDSKHKGMQSVNESNIILNNLCNVGISESLSVDTPDSECQLTSSNIQGNVGRVEPMSNEVGNIESGFISADMGVNYGGSEFVLDNMHNDECKIITGDIQYVVDGELVTGDICVDIGEDTFISGDVHPQDSLVGSNDIQGKTYGIEYVSGDIQGDVAESEFITGDVNDNHGQFIYGHAHVYDQNSDLEEDKFSIIKRVGTETGKPQSCDPVVETRNINSDSEMAFSECNLSDSKTMEDVSATRGLKRSRSTRVIRKPTKFGYYSPDESDSFNECDVDNSSDTVMITDVDAVAPPNTTKRKQKKIIKPLSSNSYDELRENSTSEVCADSKSVNNTKTKKLSKRKRRGHVGRPLKDGRQEDEDDNSILTDEPIIGNYNCLHCKLEFETPKEFINHSESEHFGLARPSGQTPMNHRAKLKIMRCIFKNSKKIRCRSCKNSYGTPLGFVFHIVNCGISKESRLESIRKMNTGNSLDDLIAAEDAPDLEDFECGCCNQNFSSFKSFKYHSFEKHAGLAQLKGSEKVYDKTTMENIIKVVFENYQNLNCFKCDKKFISLTGFKGHLKVCKHLGAQEVSQLSLLLNNNSNSCNKDLENNIESHDGTKSRKRKAAQSFYKSLKEYSVDKDIIDDSDKDCDFNFKVDDYFIADSSPNNNIIHNENDFQNMICSTGLVSCPNKCGSNFNNFNSFEIHTLVCKNVEISYTCKLCERFVKESNLEKHIVTEHRDDKLNSDSDGSEYELHNSSVKGQLNLSSFSSDSSSCISDFRKVNYSNYLFENLQYEPFKWISLTVTEALNYMPKSKLSPSFELHDPVNSKNFQSKLEIFSSMPHSSGDVFFTGGPVLSSDWCPISDDNLNTNQYLSLSCLPDPDEEVLNGQSSVVNGMIQIWNCGSRKEETAPEFSFGIVHEFGIGWSLEWCPSGTYDGSAYNDHFKRLGILAVAFSNGTIQLFVVPQVEYLSSKYYKATPNISLCFPYPLPNNTQCVKVTWCPSKGHSLIAGAFSNGMVAIWDLTTTENMETILDLTTMENVETREIYPVNIIHAHYGVCSTISFCPHTNGQHIVTGGIDRALKFWDLSCPECPLNVSKKGFVTNTVWPPYRDGLFVSFDNLLINDYPRTVYQDSVSQFGQRIVKSDSAILDSSVNDWLSVIAHCTDDGKVYLTSMKKYKTYESRAKETIYLLNIQLENINESVDLENCNFEDLSKSYSETMKKYKISMTTTNIAAAGKSFNVSHSQSQTKKSQGRSVTPPLFHSFQAVSTVKWNSNRNFHTWIFIGLNSGFGRLIRFPKVRK